MKKTFTALLLIISASTNAQIASRLLPSQAHVQPINAKNIVWVDTVAGGQQRIWVADRDSLKLYTFQIRGVKDSVESWGDLRYPQLTATYFNPTFIGSIAANKLTGLNAPMISSALGYVPADSVLVAGKLNIADTTGKWLGAGYTPPAQVNSDWASSSGVSQILNKPTIPTNTNQLTNGANFITQSAARSAISLTTIGTGAATYNSTTGVFNIPTPTTAKRQLTFSGTTNASGLFTGTFSTAFAATPNIQANIVGGTPNQFITMTVTATGFTCTVYQRNTVNLLSVEVLLGTTVLVNNANVHVLITEN